MSSASFAQPRVFQLANVSAGPRDASAARSEAKHIPALDGLRGLAILLVMATHFTLIEHGAKIDTLVGALGHFGWAGVDLFFVLSGFLITGILYDSKRDEHYFRTFYARRTLRIFPLYYAVVFFSLIVLPHLRTLAGHLGSIRGDTAPLYWLYLSNFPIAFTSDVKHQVLSLSWSLAIEEQFYLVWPIVVLLLDRRRLMKLCLALVGVAILTRAVLVSHGADRLLTYNLTPCRMDGLLVGSFVALWWRSGLAAQDAAVRLARLFLPLCAVAVAAIVAVHRNMYWTGYPGQVFGYTVLSVGFASILILTISGGGSATLDRVFSWKWMRVFGNYSYGLYLFHLPVRTLVRDCLYGPEQFLSIGGSLLPGQFIYYGICTALSLGMAVASWQLMEKHFLKLKRFFPSGGGGGGRADRGGPIPHPARLLIAAPTTSRAA
jgi:peptidoglycan/LPS O-acetylase OafA/YrhL